MKLRNCTSCGKPFRVRGDETRCSFCAARHCALCDERLPAHTGGCSLAGFERDLAFGSEPEPDEDES